jgi:hypothetical protein
VTRSEILASGGNHFIKQHYRNSFINALRAVYPNHAWKVWKFRAKLPQGFWKDAENQKEFFKDLEKELGIVNLSGWYDINPQDLEKFGANSLLSNQFKGKLANALQVLYPEHKWEHWKFSIVPRGHWKTIEAR